MQDTTQDDVEEAVKSGKVEAEGTSIETNQKCSSKGSVMTQQGDIDMSFIFDKLGLDKSKERPESSSEMPIIDKVILLNSNVSDS